MSRLFHYTSVNGLRGIIESGNIHATHLGFLNDLSEGRVAVPRDHEQYRKRLEEIDRRSPVFVASFCRHEQPHQIRNGLLSQWRGYAGLGGGYCVVFDEAALDALVEEEERAAPELVMMKKDVRYVSEAEEAAVPDEPEAFLDRLAFTKNEAFAEENETRIMMAAPHRGPRRIRFRVSEDMLVPFAEIFGERKRLPITGIIVGPGPLQRRCAAGVVQFLRAHGMDVEVTLSGIPLAR